MNNGYYFGIALILLMLTACGGPGENEAEFDGGYIWTTGDKYIALKEVEVSKTQIANSGMTITALMNAKKYFYILDSTASAELSSADFQGIYVKGDYKFSIFSFHKLEKKILMKDQSFFENKGGATKDKPFYYAGDGVAVDRKIDENGYFYKVKSPLDPGKYVGWIGSSFWILEVK